MYSPSFQQLLVQANVKDLHRSRQALDTLPITTNERIAARHRTAGKLSAYLARARSSASSAMPARPAPAF